MNKLCSLCNSLRVVGKKLLPFQTGILILINSLHTQFKELKYDEFSYFMVARCNQVTLESYFTQV